jgi:hypothetical protein
MMTSFARYRAFRLFPLLMVGFYILVTFYGARLDSRPEIFPFFNWSLFSSSSGERNEYALLIRGVEGQSLAKPQLFYDMKGTFMHARQRDVNVSKVVQELGSALHQNKPQLAYEKRRMIEERFMADVQDVQYDLVMLTFDPIERLDTGKIKNERVVASYRKAYD